jgi:hypothetical protein
VAYACRVVADGDELYANIPSVNGLFHFSLIGQSKPCGSANEVASCGKLLMTQPNNGRDVINFAYKKTRLGWSLDEINNALGGPNQHLKLSIPFPPDQHPAAPTTALGNPASSSPEATKECRASPPHLNTPKAMGFNWFTCVTGVASKATTPFSIKQ